MTDLNARRSRLLLVGTAAISVGLFFASPAGYHFTVAAIAHCKTTIAHYWPYILTAIGVIAGFRTLLAVARGRKMVRALDGHRIVHYWGPVAVIDSPEPVAFTEGLLRPRGFVSTGLLDGLSENEADAVIAHEAAHVERRDPLWTFLAAVARDALLVLPLAHHLYKEGRIAAEVRADSAAARMIGDPLIVASAIVKVQKNVAVSRPLLVPAFAADATELRVHALMGDGRMFAGSTRPSALIVASSALILLSLLTLAFGGGELLSCLINPS